MNPTDPGGLEGEVGELRARVHRLEEALYRQGILSERWQATPLLEENPPVAAVPTVPVAAPVASAASAAPVFTGSVPSAPAASAPGNAPNFSYLQSESTKPERSLESRIGSQWFNRIGILAILIGMAWFLKLAIDNHWIGPLGRVLIGLIAGAALIAWSERFRAHGYAAFSYSLKSVGSGVLYLSLWAAFSLFHLIPGSVAFAAMIGVTAFNGFLSWVQDSELLALYAIAGGFGTPLLVSTGENHEIALFSYMLLLNLTVLILVALKPWSRLLFGAFAGTVFYSVGWSSSFYSADQIGTTAFFFACFFILFALAPRIVCIDQMYGSTDAAVNTSAWDKLATILLPILNASLGFLAFYSLLESKHLESAEPWLAVLFGAFYLLLLRLPASGRWRASPVLLSELHLAAAVVFLTIAIPLKAAGRWLTIGWFAEGAALLWVGSRTRSTLLRVLALFCLALALVALLTVNPTTSNTPIFNARFATYLAGIAAFAFAAWIAQRFSTEQNDVQFPWASIAALAALIMNGLILLAIALEIHAYWWGQPWRGQYGLYGAYRMYAQFSYSALFMGFGAILLGLGFSRNSAFLRWQALVLLALSIGKVFLVDVSELSQGYRILSFLGLGALLLAVSFVYQRDWFNLRGGKGQTE
jgi:uncharacterized membrane protein